MKLYTNENETRLENRLKAICKNTDLFISVAFFSNYEFIKSSVLNGCNIKLIVRLGIGTDPDNLLKIFNDQSINDNVNIRYYACDEFHPKFYIIENVSAIIGSSNLTQRGLFHNKEVNIEIETENPIYEELKNEFDYEWEKAKVLTKEKVIEFKNYCDENGFYPRNSHGLYSKIGEVKTPNIVNDNSKNITVENIDNFRKKYQLYISAFNRLIKMYQTVTNERRFIEELPIRIEIDRFLSWIKDTKFVGEEYLDRPKKSDPEIEQDVVYLKKEFIEFNGNEYYNDTFNRYSKIITGLGTKEAIYNHSKNEILDILLLVNAIHDQLRFYEGGLKALKKEFLEKNDDEKVRMSLSYLFFGKGDYVKRIFDIIKLPEYTLKVLGESSIKELFGYINNENIPTCNQRLIHSMQWLGFGKL